jgi:hypothetical protein
MGCSEDCRFAANALADGDTTACDMRDRARAALADADGQRQASATNSRFLNGRT